MGDIINTNTDLSVMEETVAEGTYAPPAAGADFTSYIADGVNDLVIPAKEVLERGNINSSLFKSESRSGIKSVTGTLPFEFKSGDKVEPVYETYILTIPSTAAATQADYVMIYDASANSTAVWLDIDADGTTPTGALYVGSDTQIEVDIATGGTSTVNATAFHTAISGVIPGITFVDNLDGTITVTVNVAAVVTDAVPKNIDDSGAGSITVGTITQGVALVTAAPEYGIVLESALGTSSAEGTGTKTTTGHSSTVLYMTSTAEFTIGCIVLVKESGAYHVSPVASLETNTSITLLVAGSGAFSEGVYVEKLLDYKTTDSGHKSFSVTKYSEDAIRETALGCKVSSLAMESFTTGQMPKLTATYEGLSFTRTVSANVLTPVFDDSLPVIALQACVYKDGAAITLNDFSWSLENTLAPKTSTCDENGRTAIRILNTKITGSINPYRADDSVALFDNWENDDTFSLFAFAYNPTAVTGEFNEIIAMYFPTCQFGEITQSDINGLAQDNLTFEVKRDSVVNAIIAVG